MIKNLVFDVGGIIIDDSKENIRRVLSVNDDRLYKIAYGSTFYDCMLGNLSIDEHIENISNSCTSDELEKIRFISNKENMHISVPIITKNLEYIKNLKNYNLYLLSNITEETYYYLDEMININEIFKGGIYSYQEHVRKPDLEIFRRLLKKFDLIPSETVFFDDKQKNIDSARSLGMQGVLFKSIDDLLFIENQ